MLIIVNTWSNTLENDELVGVVDSVSYQHTQIPNISNFFQIIIQQDMIYMK